MKIIFCLRGSIYDVVADLRKASKSYTKHIGVKISSQDRIGIIVPKGCAHGFQTLEKNTEIIYFTSEFYNKSKETGIKYSDPILNIKWPLKLSSIE